MSFLIKWEREKEEEEQQQLEEEKLVPRKKSFLKKQTIDDRFIWIITRTPKNGDKQESAKQTIKWMYKQQQKQQ